MCKILVPIDFSIVSAKGLTMARQLIELLGGNITVMGFERSENTELNGEKRDPDQSEIGFINNYLPELTNLPEIYNSIDLTNRILSHVEDQAFDMLIIGGNPLNNENQLLDARRIELIAGKINCPIIVVNKFIDFNRFNDITFFVPLISDEHYKNYPVLTKMATKLKAKVHFLTVVDPYISSNYRSLRQLEKIATEFDIANYSIHTTHNPDIFDGLRFFNSKMNPEMIILAGGKNSRYIMIKTFLKLLEQNENSIFCKI